MVQVRVVDADRAAPFGDGVAQIWCDAFGPLADRDEWRETIWHRHRAREGYRLAVAHDAGELIGFAWGYTGQRGQYWSDLVTERLPDVAVEWIGGHFEFVELAVRTSHRRAGLGGTLHDALLVGLPHAKALLGTSTRAGDPAPVLYRSRGWRGLGVLDDTSQVMGKCLTEQPEPSPLRASMDEVSGHLDR